LPGTADVTAALQRGLDVSVGKDDEILTVSFESPYPAECALIVNSVVQAYVSYESAHRKMTAAETLAILQRERRSAMPRCRRR